MFSLKKENNPSVRKCYLLFIYFNSTWFSSADSPTEGLLEADCWAGRGISSCTFPQVQLICSSVSLSSCIRGAGGQSLFAGVFFVIGKHQASSCQEAPGHFLEHFSVSLEVRKWCTSSHRLPVSQRIVFAPELLNINKLAVPVGLKQGYLNWSTAFHSYSLHTMIIWCLLGICSFYKTQFCLS